MVRLYLAQKSGENQSWDCVSIKKVFQEASTTGTLGEEGSSPGHGNVHVERDRLMDRLEAERLKEASYLLLV